VKARIIVTCSIEYEMHPENYPKGCTPKEALDIDVAGANDDPFLTMYRENAQWTITGELIKNEA